MQRSRALNEKQSNSTILLQSIVDLANGVLILPLIPVYLTSQAAGTPRCVTIYVFKKSAILMFSYSLTTLSAMNFENIHGNSTSVPPSNSGYKRKVTGIRSRLCNADSNLQLHINV